MVALNHSPDLQQRWLSTNLQEAKTHELLSPRAAVHAGR